MASPSTNNIVPGFMRPAFQSARQIIGFPKCVRSASSTNGKSFQSARQIIGFPKDMHCDHAFCAVDVSICKADYWLPQVPPNSARYSRFRCFNLQGRLLASPKTAACRCGKASATCFNLQGRLLASPSQVMVPVALAPFVCFNLQGRLLASPSGATPTHHQRLR